MEFGSGRNYFTAMDRDYEHSIPKERATNDVGVPIKDIGFSLGLGPVPNVQALAARMRTGHKKMELTFMGMGKGSAQAHSPEMYGEKQRQAIKELQKVNRYDFTTHSSVGITGLAGMDQRGNFSKQSKENSLNEIKRAGNFAGIWRMRHGMLKMKDLRKNSSSMKVNRIPPPIMWWIGEAGKLCIR